MSKYEDRAPINVNVSPASLKPWEQLELHIPLTIALTPDELRQSRGLTSYIVEEKTEYESEWDLL